MAKDDRHHFVAGLAPTVKLGKSTLHLKKKTVPDDKLKTLADLVNKKYGHDVKSK